MKRQNKIFIWSLAAVAVIEAIFIWAWYGPLNHDAPPFRIDAAAALVIITSVALAIERSIEYFWTASGMLAGSMWPLSAISKHLTSLTDDLSAATKPYLVNSTAAVAFLKEHSKISEAEATRLSGLLTQADANLRELRKSATGSQRVESFAAAANDRMNLIAVQFEAVVKKAATTQATPLELENLAVQIVKAEAAIVARDDPSAKPKSQPLEAWVEQQASAAGTRWRNALPENVTLRNAKVVRVIDESQFGKWRTYGQTAGVAVAAVSDFLASFKENPGRRLISIELGVMAGLAIAGLAGLDVYAAVQNEGAAASAEVVGATAAGILFTGIIVGLGSSPTHEVIQVLQEDKKRRKASSAPVGGVVKDRPAAQGAALRQFMLVGPDFDEDLEVEILAAPHPADPTSLPTNLILEQPVMLYFR